MLRSLNTPAPSCSDDCFPSEFAKLPEARAYLHGVFVGRRVRVHVQAAAGDFGDHPLTNPVCAELGHCEVRCDLCPRQHGRFHRHAIADNEPRHFGCILGVFQCAISMWLPEHGWIAVWSAPVLEAPLSLAALDRALASVTPPMADGVRAALRNAFGQLPVVSREELAVIMAGLRCYVERAYGQNTGSRARPASLSDRARVFIDAHYQEEIAAADVARALGVVCSHAGRTFRRDTGRTITEYIARVRVEKARERLTIPGAKIMDVAVAVGFASIVRFNTVFKRVSGMTPSEFRRSAAANACSRAAAILFLAVAHGARWSALMSPFRIHFLRA